MRKIYWPFFAAFLVIGFAGCNLINPTELTPTYVQIDSVTFSGRANMGSSSHKITNVWVYFNSAPVGNFDLPARIPVIAAGTGTLTVAPGIDFDGLTGYEVIYPLYLADTLTVTPKPGSIIPFRPTFRYSDNAVLKLTENFDNGTGPNNIFKFRSGDDSLLNTIDSAFEGGGSGVFRLSAGEDSSIVLSGPTLPITAGYETYIELDYKGNMPLRVGVSSVLKTGGTYTEQLLGLNPRASWGKIYVGITQWISGHQSIDGTYQILLRADRPSSVSEGILRVDNIKVVSY